MVSTPSRRACWAALEAAPPYARFYNHSRERIRTLANTAAPTTAVLLRHAVEVNALRALGMLNPYGPMPQQLAATALDGARGARSIWFASRAHLLRPLQQTQGWPAAALYGAARLLVGRWHTPDEQGAERKSTKPMWTYGLLGLPQYALSRAAAHAEGRPNSRWSAAVLASAVLCAGLAGAARLAVDLTYAVSAVPMALLVFVVGLGVDVGLIIVRACRKTTDPHRAPMRFFLGPSALPMRQAPQGGDAGVIGGQEAAAQAQRRIYQVQHELQAFARLARSLASDPTLMCIFAQEVDIDSYVHHTVTLLRAVEAPQTRALYQNRVNMTRLTLPQVMDYADAWQRQRNRRPRGIEAYEGLNYAKERNAKLWALHQAFAFTDADDDRVPFVTLDLLQAQDPQTFNGYAGDTHRSADSSAVTFQEYLSLMQQFGPVLRLCVEHSSHEPLQMWDFYENFYDENSGDPHVPPLVADANRLAAKLNKYQTRKSATDCQGIFVAEQMWKQLQQQCQDSPKNLRKKLLAVHPDRLQKVLDQRRLRLKKHGRLSFDTMGFQQEEAAVRLWLKNYADALTALVMELSTTAEMADTVRAEMAASAS